MATNNPLVGTWISSHTSVESSDPVLSLEVLPEGANDSACTAIAHVLLRSEIHKDVSVNVKIIWLNKSNEARDQFFFYGQGLDGSEDNQTLVAFSGWGSVTTNPNLMTVNGGVGDCTQPVGGTVATPGTRDFDAVFRRKDPSNTGSAPPPAGPTPIFPLAGTYTFRWGAIPKAYPIVITDAGPNRVTIDQSSWSAGLIWSGDVVSPTQLRCTFSNGSGTATLTLVAPNTIHVNGATVGGAEVVWTKNS